MPDASMRLAVFASGGGSNFQSILDAIESGRIPATAVLCISNKESAGALQRAENHGVTPVVLNPSSFDSDDRYTGELEEILSSNGINFIALAGYMKKVPSRIVTAYRHRMLNIHPALLPAFGGKGYYGRRVHEAAIEYGVRWTGVTVHLVDEEYDTGPIVLQEPVPVRPDDTPDTLAQRVLQKEHRLYPEALRLFAENKVKVVGRTVIISEKLPRL